MGSSNGFSVRLFGPAEFRRAEAPLNGPARRLLARLILSARTLSRAELAQTLWPQADPERGRFYLRRALTGLRPSLWRGAELVAHGDELRLALDPCEVDVLAFDRHLREGEWARAAELHAAPLLADWPDDWLGPERESRRLAWHEAVERIALSDIREGRPAEAARRLSAAVAADPLRESSQQLLIEALRLAGDPARAERQYERFEKALRNELGVSPSPETRQALRRPAPKPVPPPVAGTERYLPVALTRLVGREAACQGVRHALGSCRLVTLVGTGGVGKTRLALACAESLPPDAADLVAMVDLTSQGNGHSLWSLVARSARAPAVSGVTVEEAALRHLERRKALLVLDNCEHLIDAAAGLAQTLLDRGPGVTILATSRQPLGLPDETVLDVPPLDPTSAEALFRESAARKGKPIPDSDAASEIVRRVCECLDGLPLALNLAAGALRTTTLGELAEDTLGILGATGGVQPRHRSLRATADWSVRLLSEAERQVLRRVSAMRGVWTPEFAPIAAGLDDGVVKACLRSLVAKSLVGLEADEKGARYRLLETIREDALRRLAEAGEEAAVRRRLRDGVLAWSRREWDLYRGDARPDTVRQIDVVESVLQDCLDSEEGRRVGVEIVYRFTQLLDHTNRYQEGAAYLDRFLADAPGLNPVLRVLALASAVLFRVNWGDGVSVLRLADETVAQALATGDLHAIAYALSSQGMALYTAKEYGLARATFEECLVHWTRIAIPEGIGNNSIWAGKAALETGDFDAAAAHFERAGAHVGRFATPHSAAVLLLNRGRLAYRSGDLDGAGGLFAEAERSFTQIGDRVHAAAARVGRAAALAPSDGVRANALLQSAERDARPLLGSLETLYDGLGPYEVRKSILAAVRT